LAFLKPDFEILAFLANQRKPDKITFFSWKGLALPKHCLAAYSLRIFSDKSLWPCRVRCI